jgi:hypothetical protein
MAIHSRPGDIGAAYDNIIGKYTFARLMYSFKSGVAGCSKESKTSVRGDAVSRKLKSFEIKSKLCVLLCERLIGAIFF